MSQLEENHLESAIHDQAENADAMQANDVMQASDAMQRKMQRREYAEEDIEKWNGVVREKTRLVIVYTEAAMEDMEIFRPYIMRCNSCVVKEVCVPTSYDSIPLLYRYKASQSVDCVIALHKNTSEDECNEYQTLVTKCNKMESGDKNKFCPVIPILMYDDGDVDTQCLLSAARVCNIIEIHISFGHEQKLTASMAKAPVVPVPSMASLRGKRIVQSKPAHRSHFAFGSLSLAK